MKISQIDYFYEIMAPGDNGFSKCLLEYRKKPGNSFDRCIISECGIKAIGLKGWSFHVLYGWERLKVTSFLGTIIFWAAIVIFWAEFSDKLGGYCILCILGFILIKIFIDTYLIVKIREQEFIESQLQIMGHHMEIMEDIKKNMEIQTKIQVQQYKHGNNK